MIAYVGSPVLVGHSLESAMSDPSQRMVAGAERADRRGLGGTCRRQFECGKRG